MEDKESEIKVYKTTDYGAFKKMLGNRDVKSVAKIVRSVQTVGQVIDPIIVNENDEVINGQNRIEAFKQLGLPIYYIRQKGLNINHCRYLNIGQTNWGTEDYIASYAAEGNESYQRLASLLNTYRKSFSIDGVVAMANPTTIAEGGPTALYAIKPGRYELSEQEYEQAVRRLDAAEKLGYVELCKRRKFAARIFWSCVAYIYLDPDVHPDQVILKLTDCEAAIPSCNKVSEQLSFIDDALNRGARSNSKVFLYADFQKRLYMEDIYAK